MVSDLKLIWLGPERCGLQIVDEGHHPIALVRIWQAAAHCTEIVGHMYWVRGAGNNCRHPFVAEQVFEKKLARGCVEVLGPVRQALAFNRPEQYVLPNGIAVSTAAPASTAAGRMRFSAARLSIE